MLRHIANDISLVPDYDGAVPCAEVCSVLEGLAGPQDWDFLQEINYETARTDHLHDLDLYERWCQDMADAPTR